MPTNKKSTRQAKPDKEEQEIILSEENTGSEDVSTDVKPKRKYIRKEKKVEDPQRQIDSIEQLSLAADKENLPEPDGEVIDDSPMNKKVEQKPARSFTPSPAAVHANDLHHPGEVVEPLPKPVMQPKLKEEVVRDVSVSGPTSRTFVKPTVTSNDLKNLRMKTAAMKSSSDANFLVPEKFDFNLKEKQERRKKTRWVSGLLYFLGTLVILSALALFLLSAYSTQLLNRDADVKESSISEEVQQPVVNEVSLKLAIVNAPKDIQDKISSLAKAEFGNDLSYDSAFLPTLPQVKTDTLFYTEKGRETATALQKKLEEKGLKTQIQANTDMSADVSLYLVTTLAQPDLSGVTSAVYNATGVAGLARKNCDVLNRYKAESCQALNSTTQQTGSTVAYKTDGVFYTLRRTNEFKDMKFVQAPTDQVEDLRITIGN